KVAISRQAVSLEGIRLLHGQQLCLEGDALVPLDLWNAWPNTALRNLLNDITVTQVKLTASDLDLGLASQLTGRKFPIAGKLRGNLAANGRLTALQLSGKLAMSDSSVALGFAVD